MITFTKQIQANCPHSSTKKSGLTKAGTQRYKCLDCGKRFTESTNTLAGMRIDTDRAAKILHMLCEGLSVRATARLSDVSIPTILDLLVLVGTRCKRYMEASIVNAPVQDLQCDELWSRVYCKEKTRRELSLPILSYGDQYCFVGIERHHKMVLAWQLGNRDAGIGEKFVKKLARACCKTPFQVTTDGWRPYKPLIRTHLPQAAYAMLIKVYGKSQDTVRYSPAPIIETKLQIIAGNPDESRACTSHVERQNLSIRMGMRRFTRLTNGFSKSFDHHEAALGLYFGYYNYVQRHGTIKTTPAVAAGQAEQPWTLAELIDRTADCDPPTAFESFMDSLEDE